MAFGFAPPILLAPTTTTTTPTTTRKQSSFPRSSSWISTALASTTNNSDNEQPSSTTAAAVSVSAPSSPGVVLNGKRILPYRIVANALRGQAPVPAVYAVLNGHYQKTTDPDGWSFVMHVGVTQDVAAALQSHVDLRNNNNNNGDTDGSVPMVAHVRALSFATPEPLAMQKVANDWKTLAQQAGAKLENWGDDVLNYLFDYDDDDDDDEEDFLEDIMAATTATSDDAGGAVISPFDSSSSSSASTTTSSSNAAPMPFTAENVDKVLNEVRPYLIADGGNVAVQRVDEVSKNVYLQLQGACGSCPSSTVTMQMGIERVLREQFPDLGQVLQVTPESELALASPESALQTAVQEEVTRLSAAVTAMGGVVRVVSIDAATGTVQIMYKGPKKVRMGLELAIRDVPQVQNVEFVEEMPN